MKNFISFFKAPLFFTAMLFVATTSIAQTVTVPSNCTVINVGTGTGGVLGFGGKVTDNGIVAMPDQLLVSPFTPNQGGTFTFNPPGGVSTASWSLKGDLSNTATAGTISGVSGNYNGVTQPAAGLTANIISYNKAYRPNSTETANPSWARSKGQVKVSYTLTGCGNVIIFDVYKNFTQSPPIIVGPDCLKPNTTYTYSVDRIVSDNPTDNIGFDSYYWSGLPANIYPPTLTNSFYTSADTSSITFTTGSPVTPFTLQCCYGRVNPNTSDGGVSSVLNTFVAGSHTTCVTKSLLIAPAAPVFSATTLATLTTLNSTSSACLPIGQANFTITYPNPPVTTPIPTVYTWTALNTGWTFGTTTSGGNSTTTVTTNGNNNPGTLTLTVTGPCDPAIYNYQINRNLAASTTIIPVSPTINYCIASTSSNTYTINASAVGVTLNWSTIPATVTGLTLVPSGNTNSVTLNAAGVAPGTSFTLQAQGASPCGTPVISTTIYVQPATPVFTAGTPNCVVRSATAINTVGVTPVSGATYDWTPLPAGVTCTANCNTANPSFVFNSAVGVTSVTLTVKILGAGSCNSNSATKVINYITVATNFTGGAFNDQYSVITACGSVTSWDIGTASGTTTYFASSGNVTITGTNNNNLQISGTTGLPLTSVCANLASGLVVCANLTPATGPPAYNTQRHSNPANGGTKFDGVKISPNPNSGSFSIKVIDFDTNASAVLTDFSGNEIQAYQLRKGENKIEKQGLSKGTYLVVLKIDGEQETRQVIVE